MRYEILNGTSVVNTIIAKEEFMTAHYPDHNYRVVPDIIVTEPKLLLTRLQFLNRFTVVELTDIYTAAKSSVAIEIMLDKFKSAEFIDTTDPQTIGGINALESAGFIDPHRAAEILA